ncbi:7619_t:CDS:2 [Funneliformis mosseae]|uniref:7619_t:CDS:1 n=1 Tax=Funneliformis mosseae TaxID=27381 RepID=A0A9N9GKJ2_FUNMO|nr:7619_t:CDS:2 [Funneliformis mosseae]
MLNTNIESLSEINNKKFKSILVYLIYRKLPNRFKKEGRQLVSLAHTEHQFFDIFKGYIYHRNNRNGRRFYNEEQQTYVVLFDDLPQHLKNNPLAITTYHAVESIITKRRKSKYNPGEVNIDWKIKVEKDAKDKLL